MKDLKTLPAVNFTIRCYLVAVYTTEGDVMLRHEISLKAICQKVKFSNCDFYNNFVTMNGHTNKLFKYLSNDFLTKGKGEINMV